MTSGGKSKGVGSEPGVRVIAENRRARFDYTVDEKLEAGLALTGSEVKSLRDGIANLSDAYALPKGDELFLLNANIGSYKAASFFDHLPTRGRKLLMHRGEIDRWTAKVRERGYSIIPLVLYFRNGRAKVELGLCRGKTHEDRRHDIKERETKREMDRAMRRR
ncbi:MULTISPECIES: SsrA-binding protein SmpB [Myxococcus]|uniref:SsrA-binding protein n=2 Tax=Myxococcus TaxID=32 RepID=A0A511HMY3_9BACT|nr:MULTISPECIES: SsrA-binding protein SmpB [Myxococcus]NOJ78946.1 SsrA-binding protein SmpB [Myxococcus xanthus]NOJ88762.1 SsrA-binding protein SmpB [Myxococcus xanthus]QDE89096.1 SsrA-binding protein [Myxococcus xanthus]QQR46346.1 SsrA-binding protein SmpB [Myxococcus xanthus]WNZ64150.1 SsrA-binding protein SmpB [Myxococcus sp. MxC21-1]